MTACGNTKRGVCGVEYCNPVRYKRLGTVVMAASSAAYNIEIITYDILNSFSQACTTFVGQNVGAGEMKRCHRTLFLCLAEGIVTLSLAVALIFCSENSARLLQP